MVQSDIGGGRKVNCQEADRLFGPVIDGKPTAGEQEALRTHTGACRPCRKNFELETMAKRIVHSHVPHASAPDDVRAVIVESVRRASGSLSAGPRMFDRLWEWLFPAPALTLGAAVIALLFLVSPDTRVPSSAGTDGDVIAQALHNFDMIKAGTLKPAVATADPESARHFFEPQHLSFAVDVRPLDGCARYEALTSEYHGMKLAHVVYRLGSDLLYVYEAKCEDVMKGSTLSLPKQVSARVTSDGWYVDSRGQGTTIAVWDREGTLCVAASTLDADRMKSLLAVR